jgi:Cys-rich repeat protein
MRRYIGIASVLALTACGNNSVVGGIPPRSTGPVDAGETDASAIDAAVAMDTAVSPDLPTPPDAPPLPDVVADAGCGTDNDCPGMLCDVSTGRCVPCTAQRQNLCPPTQHCADNRCVDGCRADDGCASTPTTPRCDATRNTCVQCVEDAQCGAGELCRANACVPGCSPTRACPNGGACCDGACFDPSTSADHCGACGVRCMTAGATPACQGGRCTVGACNAGLGDCDADASNGCETDVATSLTHCGMCGNACPARANAVPTCAAGACGFTCSEGFADCDRDPTNGCEVALGTDTANCGACGNTCAARANAAPACVAGACGNACNDGFADCDRDEDNGCEVDTRSSNANCGACGNACTAGANATAACTAGRCASTCGAGFANCDNDPANGCEANLRTSTAHCGVCGSACGTGEQCVFGGGMSMGDACRPGCFISVERVTLPGTSVILGVDPAWGAPRTVTGTTSRAAALVDATTSRVTAAVISVPAVGDARAEATRLEAAVVAALGSGATPVLVGRAITSHEGFAGVASTYRVTRSTTAAVLRDALIAPLTGAAAPTTPTWPTAGTFIVEVTTVRRTAGAATDRTDLIVAIASQVDVENNAIDTAITLSDLANATHVVAGVEALGFQCQQSRATVTAPVVDFLWTVDTSSSMNSYQAQIGNAATQFFARMNAAGLDFRVSVLAAGTTTLNLDSPGYTWISGTATDGALDLCRRVTIGACPTGGTDSLRPYAMGGSGEEPTAAAVVAHDALRRRALDNEANMDRRLRPNARFVAVFVTDESGNNDFSRYFSSRSAPDNNTAFGTSYNTTTLNNIVGYFQRNNILTFGIVPVSTTACSSAAVADLPRCVIQGNGGAAIPIGSANDMDVTAALTRIVDGIGGATSEFRLPRTPITSMIRVRVRGMEAPRSRINGFDYDFASRSVVFYGSTWRPRSGDEVVISYRTWGS